MINKNTIGFNVIGDMTALTGLGRVARELVRLLSARNESFCTFDIQKHFTGKQGPDHSCSRWEVADLADLRYEVNIFVIGALQLQQVALEWLGHMRGLGRLNVVHVSWELTELPNYLYRAAEMYDVILTGSHFTTESLLAHISRVPVLTIKQPCQIPVGVTSNRAKFGIPESGFIVYNGFDPNSCVYRKNPFLCIAAFQRAFNNIDDAHLVMKVNHRGRQKELGELRDLVKNDPRIIIISSEYGYFDLMELYSSCDVFISLHRSEGFGLILLEAMRLGKPVVATSWSGNLSFMNHKNSCLVGYDLVTVDARSVPYSERRMGKKHFWADPDISEAAKWLRLLYEDEGARLDIGSRASSEADQYESDAMDGAFLDELNRIYEARGVRADRDFSGSLNMMLASYKKYRRSRYLRVIKSFISKLHRRLIFLNSRVAR